MSRIRYGAILSTAWNRLWHAWVLWRFALVYAVAYIVLFGVPYSVFLATILDNPGRPNVPFVITSAAAFCVGLLALVGFAILYQGGMLWLTNEVEAGGTPKFGDGLAAGGRAFWRLLGFDLVISAVVIAVVGVFAGAVVALIVSASATSGPSFSNGGPLPVALIGGICCLYAFLIFAALGASVVFGPLIAVGKRAITIEGARVGGGFSAGWSTIRYRFKNSVVTSLMLTGLVLAFSMAVNLVTQPLYFFAYGALGISTPSGSSGHGIAFALVFFVTITVAMLGAIPSMVFLELGWTAFWRQLTGRDVPPEHGAPVAPPLEPTTAAGPPMATHPQGPPMAPMPTTPPAAPVPPGPPMAPPAEPLGASTAPPPAAPPDVPPPTSPPVAGPPEP